jgi:acylphosphatase
LVLVFFFVVVVVVVVVDDSVVDDEVVVGVVVREVLLSSDVVFWSCTTESWLVRSGWASSEWPPASMATVANAVDTTTPATLRARYGVLRNPLPSLGGASSIRSSGPSIPALLLQSLRDRPVTARQGITVTDCDFIRVGMSPNVRLTAWVHGQVQGVGFRWWTRSRASELGLVGYAGNLRDGRVEVVAEGPRDDCVTLLELLRSDKTPGRVDLVVERWSDAKNNVTGFVER